MYDVRAFGAQGDRQVNDRDAIQAAIDSCSKSGGGTVHLPPGDYLSGNLQLRSHVTLYLEAGATLWASTDPRDYGSQHDPERSGRWTAGTLLGAQDAEHISILGEGVIHGQGTADYGKRWGVLNKPSFRTSICLFDRCKQVAIRGVSILYSDSWTLHLRRCETVFIDGVTIRNNPRRLNSDGIDPNSCRNVHISNCHIVAGDDCIVLKATEPYPCENVVVTNCTLETTCTAIKLGTESFGDFRDVHVSGCTIRNTRTGVGFYLKDGATMERITLANLSIEADLFPIFVDVERRYPDSRVGQIRDVSLRDVFIQSRDGLLIQGMSESPIENLTMQNIHMRVTDAVDYARRSKPKGSARSSPDDRDTCYARQPSYMALAHVQGLVLDNVSVRITEEDFSRYERSAVYGHALEDGVLRNVRRQPVGREGQIPVIDLHDCQRVSVA
jgi:polygalacturonase